MSGRRSTACSGAVDVSNELLLTDRRQDAEGAISFRRVNKQMQAMHRGHGGSSGWRNIEYEAAVVEAMEVAKYNYGDHQDDHGYFTSTSPASARGRDKHDGWPNNDEVSCDGGPRFAR